MSIDWSKKLKMQDVQERRQPDHMPLLSQYRKLAIERGRSEVTIYGFKLEMERQFRGSCGIPAVHVFVNGRRYPFRVVRDEIYWMDRKEQQKRTENNND